MTYDAIREADSFMERLRMFRAEHPSMPSKSVDRAMWASLVTELERARKSGMEDRAEFNTSLLQLAIHAPPCPEWYMADGLPDHPLGMVAKHDCPEPTMSIFSNEDRCEACADACKEYRLESVARDRLVSKWHHTRLASWPWYYAKMVLDARPKE